MMKLLKKYRAAVFRACIGEDNTETPSVLYWQNRFFANTMAVVLPLSLLTLIPGVIYSIAMELALLAILDVLSFAVVIYIGLGKGASIQTRKFMLIAVTYFAAIYLLIYVGFKGPGFLFLYSACVFALLILPVRYAYLWSWINVAVCVFFGFIVHYNLSPLPEMNALGIWEWIAIAINLLFLSFLTSALLPMFFKGLSQSLEKQVTLQKEVSHKHAELEETLSDLEVKNQELEQFAYLASHDLQEPLRMVNSFLTQLHKKYQGQLDDKAQQYIYFAKDGATRMRNMINDLLQFSRVGRNTGELESIPLNSIVNEVISNEQDRISETGATINFDNLPVVKSYRTPLLQIFQNLISNGLKYREKNTKPIIEIKVEELKNEWQFCISDNGIGIEPDYFDKIFVIFQRLHTGNEYSGTGMGLAIVKKNIDNLGGKLWVKSEPGNGSQFFFTLLKHS